MEVVTNYAKESITVSSTAIGFTESIMEPTSDHNKRPDRVEFIVETQPIRYSMIADVDPTSALGLLGAVGDKIVIEGQANARAFRAIRTGTDGTIQPHFFHR